MVYGESNTRHSHNTNRQIEKEKNKRNVCGVCVNERESDYDFYQIAHKTD